MKLRCDGSNKLLIVYIDLAKGGGGGREPLARCLDITPRALPALLTHGVILSLVRRPHRIIPTKPRGGTSFHSLNSLVYKYIDHLSSYYVSLAPSYACVLFFANPFKAAPHTRSTSFYFVPRNPEYYLRSPLTQTTMIPYFAIVLLALATGLGLAWRGTAPFR